jgi:uncharacterized protein
VGSELTLMVFGLSGVAAGFFAGLFGIGGGLIMVPALVYAFKTTGTRTQHAVAMALGTSMAAIVFFGGAGCLRPLSSGQYLH